MRLLSALPTTLGENLAQRVAARWVDSEYSSPMRVCHDCLWTRLPGPLIVEVSGSYPRLPAANAANQPHQGALFFHIGEAPAITILGAI
jgi:hypothetical protein